MGDLKGLLDKEGIDIGRPLLKNESIPTLTADLLNNELISHFEEQQKNHSDPLKSEPDSLPEDPQDNFDLPVLDGTISVTDEPLSADIDDYIADMDDDDFDVMEFADSVEELEEKVQSITQPEDLLKFEELAQNTSSPKSDVPPAESVKIHSTITETFSEIISESHSKTSNAHLSQAITEVASNAPPSFNDLTTTIHFEQLKEKLHKQLSFQIEISIAELKSKLLSHLEAELNAAFKK